MVLVTLLSMLYVRNIMKYIFTLSLSASTHAHSLPACISRQTVTSQCPFRFPFFGLTITKSTVDCILVLCVLTERLHDSPTGLLAAYVDLRKAFESVNQDVLWRIVALHEILPKLVNLISACIMVQRVMGGVMAQFPFTFHLLPGCIWDMSLPQHSSTLA